MGVRIPKLTETAAAPSSLTDAGIVARVRAGDRALFEILMRRHNQRIYRVARAVLKDEDEVEDVMQQAYVNAYTHLHQFEERSQFSTWLTRIALNEAFRRRRHMQRFQSPDAVSSDVDANRGETMDTIASAQPDPERQAYSHELSRAL